MLFNWCTYLTYLSRWITLTMMSSSNYVQDCKKEKRNNIAHGKKQTQSPGDGVRVDDAAAARRVPTGAPPPPKVNRRIVSPPPTPVFTSPPPSEHR